MFNGSFFYTTNERNNPLSLERNDRGPEHTIKLRKKVTWNLFFFFIITTHMTDQLISFSAKGLLRSSKTRKLWVGDAFGWLLGASYLFPIFVYCSRANCVAKKVQTNFFLPSFLELKLAIWCTLLYFLLYYIPMVTAVFFLPKTPGLRRPNNTIMAATTNKNRTICHKRNAWRFRRHSGKKFPLHLTLCCSSNLQLWLTAKLVLASNGISDISSTNNRTN